jgi:hypothetical protein
MASASSACRASSSTPRGAARLRAGSCPRFARAVFKAALRATTMPFHRRLFARATRPVRAQRGQAQDDALAVGVHAAALPGLGHQLQREGPSDGGSDAVSRAGLARVRGSAGRRMRRSSQLQPFPPCRPCGRSCRMSRMVRRRRAPAPRAARARRRARRQACIVLCERCTPVFTRSPAAPSLAVGPHRRPLRRRHDGPLWPLVRGHRRPARGDGPLRRLRPVSAGALFWMRLARGSRMALSSSRAADMRPTNRSPYYSNGPAAAAASSTRSSATASSSPSALWLSRRCSSATAWLRSCRVSPRPCPPRPVRRSKCTTPPAPATSR